MRKGYTIIELLGLAAIVVIIFSLSAKPIWIMTREGPHIDQMYATQDRIDMVCGEIQKDVQGADRIMTLPASRWTGGHTLYCHGPAGWTAWNLQPGWILRLRQATPGSEPQGQSWTLPHAELEWTVYKVDNHPVGVELQTRINRPLLGAQQMKFKQSRLYFMGVQSDRL